MVQILCTCFCSKKSQGHNTCLNWVSQEGRLKNWVQQKAWDMKCIGKWNINKSRCPDGVHPKVLKEINAKLLIFSQKYVTFSICPLPVSLPARAEDFPFLPGLPFLMSCFVGLWVHFCLVFFIILMMIAWYLSCLNWHFTVFSVRLSWALCRFGGEGRKQFK